MRYVRTGMGAEMTNDYMMRGDIVKWLRAQARLTTHHAFNQAADRIEQLEAALREVISVSDRKTDIYDRAKAALGGKKHDR